MSPTAATRRAATTERCSGLNPTGAARLGRGRRVGSKPDQQTRFVAHEGTLANTAALGREQLSLCGDEVAWATACGQTRSRGGAGYHGANMNAESRPAFVARHLIVANPELSSHQPARSWCELADPGRKIDLWFPGRGFASIAAQSTLLLAWCTGRTAFVIGALSVGSLKAAVVGAGP